MRGSLRLGLLFISTAALVGIACSSGRAQESSPPEESAAFSATEVEVSGDGFTVPGTLVLPEADHPVPCLVFVAGSGPTDRDWTTGLIPGAGDNGSGQQLAEALAGLGVGSLRYDKMGTGQNQTPPQVIIERSIDLYVDEGLAAYAHLSAEPACGANFILGHSEGAMHALRMATRVQNEADFAGMISMSGTARPLQETLVSQVRPGLLAAGYDASTVDSGLARFQEGIAGLPGSLSSPPDFSDIPDLLQLWQLTSQSGPPAMIRDLLTFDPIEAAGGYRGPVMVMSAANDVQIPVSEGDLLMEAFAHNGSARRRVIISEASHVYKHDTRTLEDTDPMTLVMGYFEEGRPLAAGTAETIADFVSSAAAGGRE